MSNVGFKYIIINKTRELVVSDLTPSTEWCTLDTGKWTLNTTHCTLNTAHCSLNTKYCTLNTAHCTLNTTHCPLNTVHRTLNITHCTLYTAHCILHTAYYTLQAAHCTLLDTSAHCKLQSEQCTQLTAHCTSDCVSHFKTHFVALCYGWGLVHCTALYFAVLHETIHWTLYCIALNYKLYNILYWIKLYTVHSTKLNTVYYTVIHCT